MLEDDGNRSKGSLRPYGRRRRFRVDTDRSSQIKGETIKPAKGLFGEDVMSYTSEAYMMEWAVAERVKIPWVVTRKKEMEELARLKKEEAEKLALLDPIGREVMKEKEVDPFDEPPSRLSGPSFKSWHEKKRAEKNKKPNSSDNDDGGWL